MLDDSVIGTTSRDASQGNALRQQHDSILPVLWRYRWLLVACAVAGLWVGYVWHAQKPAAFRAKTRIMFRSDVPLTLDSVTGMVRGGIPSGKLVQSLIRSESILRRVASDERLMNLPGMRHLSPRKRLVKIRDRIEFTALTDLQDSRDRLIASIHYEGDDREVCRAAVESVAQAIEQHFQDERDSRINEFAALIGEAQEILLPQQRQLEGEYKRFRQDAALEWASDGTAINPHRERQRHLQQQRDVVEQETDRLAKELQFMQRICRLHHDPAVVGQILTHLGDQSLSEGLGMIDREYQAQRNDVKNHLFPLSLRLEELELEFGKSHPEVLAVRRRLDRSMEQLRQLGNSSLLYASRSDDPNPEASEEDLQDTLLSGPTLDVLVSAYEERLKVTRSELDELDQRIEAEKRAADALKNVEDEDASYRRRLASVRGMLIQLEEQLSAIDLADVSGGIIVEPLLNRAEIAVIGPNLHRDLALGSLLGAMIGGLLAVLIECTARTFRSASEIQRELKLPVLTHIPVDSGKASGRSIGNDLGRQVAVVHRPYSPAAESIRGLRTSLLLKSRKEGARVFQITSPLPGDGKSTLAANVAASIAQSGKRTLVIDLDLRSPRLSLRFNLKSESGLANVLNGEISPEEAIHQSSLENLDVLPCGPLPSNPSEALTLAELGDVIQWCRENYDFVIVDTPPVLMVSDPTIVTPMVDAVILVLRIRRRSRPNAREAISLLQWTGTEVMGVVVNKLRRTRGFQNYESSAQGSYQTYGYGHGDRYRKRYQKEVESTDTYLVKGSGNSRRIDRSDHRRRLSQTGEQRESATRHLLSPSK